MMHEIGRELETALRAKGCPFKVVDGPEPTTTTTWGRERIVIEYGKGFKFDGPQSQHVNPKQPWSLAMPGVITIYAQSPKAGANYFEHQRRALAVVRMVSVALRKVLVARKNWPTMVSGDFTDPPDLAASESRGGAVFTFTFSCITGVPDLTWAGAAQDEVTIAADTIESSTVARLHGAADADVAPETACG